MVQKPISQYTILIQIKFKIHNSVCMIFYNRLSINLSVPVQIDLVSVAFLIIFSSMQVY